MGEQQNQPFQLSFNPALKVDFQGSRVTSDGGMLLVRELDERLGLGELIAGHLTDSRGKNMQLPMADLLRQTVYSRLAGYEDVTMPSGWHKASGGIAGAAGTEKSIQNQEGTEKCLTKPDREAVASNWQLTLPQSGP